MLWNSSSTKNLKKLKLWEPTILVLTEVADNHNYLVHRQHGPTEGLSSIYLTPDQTLDMICMLEGAVSICEDLLRAKFKS